MIRINLATSVPVGTIEGGGEAIEGMQGDVSGIQRAGVMRLLVILVAPLILYFYEFQNIPELKSKLQSKSTYLASLTQKNEQAKGAVEEIKKFKEDQSRLQRQIDTLESLQKERLKEVKILDNLQKDIPEKVWLTRLDFQDVNLVIDGVTTSDSELTLFMENLSKSVFLKEVNLVKSSEVPSDKGLLKKFEIVCVIDRPNLSGMEGKKQ